MAVIDHEAELPPRRRQHHRPGAASSFFTARRYPLGAIGAVIVLTFVFTAVFADLITPFDPTSTNAAPRWRRPAARTRSAPTSWAATCSAASSTARASRSRSASAPPRSAA